jgi:FKBP-type peptidyl-prolyl cis-trans isomerase
VIKGWSEGIPGMRIGGRRELVIPSALAYGSQGGPSIPPNTPLLFVIDALGISSGTGA